MCRVGSTVQTDVVAHFAICCCRRPTRRDKDAAFTRSRAEWVTEWDALYATGYRCSSAPRNSGAVRFSWSHNAPIGAAGHRQPAILLQTRLRAALPIAGNWRQAPALGVLLEAQPAVADRRETRDVDHRRATLPLATL